MIAGLTALIPIRASAIHFAREFFTGLPGCVAKLVSEIVPSVGGVRAQMPTATSEIVARAGTALGREEKRGTRADGRAKYGASGKDGYMLPIEFALVRDRSFGSP